MGKRLLTIAMALFFVSTAVAVNAEPDPGPDPAGKTATAAEWAPLAFLVGRWEGTGGGATGASAGAFSVEPEAEGHALLRRSENVSPQGRHADVMLIYRDGKTFRALYTDNEGHVIHYTVTATSEPKGAVFLSDEVPGSPRFRLSYQLGGEGTLAIRFEIAPPGTTVFKTYVEGSARRK